MSTRSRKTVLGFLLAAVTATAFAGEAVAVKHTLTLHGARKVGEAAVAYAKSSAAPGGAIAVVDDGGHLMYFVRLDGTFTGSPNISIGKASTAALFRKPTSEFENLVNQGRFALTALPPDFTPLQGGMPIKHGDHVLDAIAIRASARSPIAAWGPT